LYPPGGTPRTKKILIRLAIVEVHDK